MSGPSSQFSKAPPPQTDLQIGNESIFYIDEAKVLGIMFQSNIKWDAKINDMLRKANRLLFLIKNIETFWIWL